MLIILCITILAYWIMGKDIRPLLKRVKDVDWRGKASSLMCKLRPYALNAGRIATRPLLQFYYVMTDAKTSSLDKALIYAAIIYTVSPVSLIPSAVYKLIGIMDEGAAMVYVYRKVKGKITPEINSKVDETLDEWFGARYVGA